MAFRFWRRIKVAPGVTLNLSKSGGSLSFGPRGAKFTVGSRGRRATVGIPGTGLFYTQKVGGGRKGAGKGGSRAGARATAAAPTVSRRDRLTLGFFRRLVTPDDEEAFVDGCRELVLGDEGKALGLLEGARHLADGAYLAGFLALKRERAEDAARRLATAAEKHARLGTYFSRYGISAVMSLPITDEVSVHVGPDLRGALLGLVEAYQRLDRPEDAIACLERLRRLEPDDVVVKLSLAELLLEPAGGDAGEPAGRGDGHRRKGGRSGPSGVAPGARGPGADACRRVVRLAEGIENETEVHAALLLYKARALRGLGLPDAARETLTVALRRRKDRSDGLLRALRYERARVYEDLGRRRQARIELEKIYADAPDYEDVASRLGL